MGGANLQIQPATRDDWPTIERIYRAGIRTGHATFEVEDDIPDGETWFASKAPGLIFKAVDDGGQIVGWAAISPFSARRVYRGVGEVSVYVSPAEGGKGIGSALLGHLVTASEEAGFWTLQAKIFPENVISIDLHLNFGFRVVGIREKLGQLYGVWRDVVLLERRSPKF